VPKKAEGLAEIGRSVVVKLTDFLLVLSAGFHKSQHQFTRDTTFCTVVTNILGTSVRNLIHFTV
jgi:hypothetical protein